MNTFQTHPQHKKHLLMLMLASSFFSLYATQTHAACRSSFTTPFLKTFNLGTTVTVSNSTPIGEAVAIFAAPGSGKTIATCDAGAALIAHNNISPNFPATANPQIIQTNVPGIGIRISFKSVAQNAEGIYPHSLTMRFPAANSPFINDDTITLSLIRTGTISAGTLNTTSLGGTSAAGALVRSMRLNSGTAIKVATTTATNLNIVTLPSEDDLPTDAVNINPFSHQ